MDYKPVVDISEHQGPINFSIMRSRGVPFLIMRVSHGHKRDARFAEYYRQAIEAGYQPHEIAFYPFINPKRGSAEFTAGVAAQYIKEVTGRTAVTYMMDIESYRQESPNIGTVTLVGKEFSAYIRAHRAAFVSMMPGALVVGYTNRAYWNSDEGPNDDVLAAEFEWIVPRYPLYSDAAYQSRGYPPSPDKWADYAFGLAAGPYPPRGSTWRGWQFSAGFNKQARPYGCGALIGDDADLDLNILDPVSASKWFPAPVVIEPDPIPEPIQPKEPDMLIPHGGVRIFNGKVLAQTPTLIHVADGTPGDATGVAINITFNGSYKPGFATLWDGVGSPPIISQINWSATGVPSNSFTIVPVSIGAFAVQALEDVNLIFDQVGYTMMPPSVSGVTVTDEHIRAVIAQALGNG